MDMNKLRHTVADDRLTGLERRITELESITGEVNRESVRRDAVVCARCDTLAHIVLDIILPMVGLTHYSDELKTYMLKECKAQTDDINSKLPGNGMDSRGG